MRDSPAVTDPAPLDGPDTGTDVAISRACRLAGSRPLLIVTDFDGTLAPIVAEPSTARIVPAARRALRRLMAAADAFPEGDVVVAVLSGRDAGDVATRVNVPGIRYLGQHGIEHASLPAVPRARPIVAADPVLEEHGRMLERLAGRTDEILGRPSWLVVERKGASIGLHYRRADDPEEARRAIHAALDAAQGEVGPNRVARMESRRVVELRPDGAPGKGEATRRLIVDVAPRSILVIGDDRTDAAAFRRVGDARDAGAVEALVLGVSGAGETPVEVADSVDLMLPSPDAAAAVIAGLAAALRAVLGQDADPTKSGAPMGRR